MTATADRDLAALLAAVDDDQPGALGQLADLLEERGDPRAATLRWPRLLNKQPARCLHWGHESEYVWDYIPDGWQHSLPHQLPKWLFERLPGEGTPYPSRSAAYLALAEALSEQ